MASRTDPLIARNVLRSHKQIREAVDVVGFAKAIKELSRLASEQDQPELADKLESLSRDAWESAVERK